jgi:predicted DNA repair protein MutK
MTHPDPDLRPLTDSALAQFQEESERQDNRRRVFLSEREWERRMIEHQLREQFALDERLAAASKRSAQQLAAANHWWALAAAVVGVLGTIAGAWLGAYWQSRMTGLQISQGASSPAEESSRRNLANTVPVPTTVVPSKVTVGPGPK